MRRGKRRFCSLIMIIMATMLFVFPANAATISGNASNTTTFYVSTNSKLLSSRKVTLTQNGKGKAIGVKLFGGTKKYYSMYGRYRVTVSYDSKGKTYSKTYDWTGNKKTFSLAKNRKYKFTVRPYSKTDLHTTFQSIVKGFGFYGWKTTPSWKATGGSGTKVSYSYYNQTSLNPYITLSPISSTGGSSFVLKATTSPANVSVNWNSSNTSVAIVSGGKVIAKCPGTTVITASMNYGGKVYSAKKTIKVTGNKKYGSWSSWSLSPVSATESREVKTTKMYRYYSFNCPVCGGREPFQGMSDCHRYSLSLANAEEKWFPIPYASSNPKSYSYTKRKYYTTSLGDGKIWNFSSGNLYSTAIGTKDSDSEGIVIKTGYSYRPVYGTNCKIVSFS